jgi:hypothetical protein
MRASAPGVFAEVPSAKTISSSHLLTACNEISPVGLLDKPPKRPILGASVKTPIPEREEA